MLKQVSRRRQLSKTGQWLFIILAILITVAVFIFLLFRPSQNTAEPDQPLNLIKQYQQIS